TIRALLTSLASSFWLLDSLTSSWRIASSHSTFLATLGIPPPFLCDHEQNQRINKRAVIVNNYSY
ncbi:MAG: hypothetical protein LBE85_04370, partial [Candidatus Accumulibacter sp.]|nr:hypothetical protein [Accumulibacter sp.]